MGKNVKQTIGLVGLGNAGLALGGALAKRFDICGFDQQPERVQAAQQKGIRPCSSLSELVGSSEFIFLSLPTPEASRAVASSMSELALTGKLLIETSTVNPKDAQWLLDYAQARGASAMDAAVLGGVKNLSEGKTTFLVGASAEDYSRSKMILESVSKKIFYMGAVGNGMRIKLINNAVAHTTMVMLLEAAAMSAKAGIGLDVFYELMNSESGLTRPLTHRLKERVYSGDYEAGMSTANARKDSLLALAMAQELKVPLFTMQASHTVYEIASQQGLEGLDYASIATLWEKWGDLSFQTPQSKSEQD
jgi:3-hydroxyisobutyrate dehydrogenase-like beta-hydroxyacid dehydrogenase